MPPDDASDPGLHDARSYRSVDHEPDVDKKTDDDGDKGEEGKDEGGGEKKPKKKGLLQRPVTLVLIAVLVLVVVLLGVLFWLNARHWASTDDAFVDARIVHLAPQVPGRVLQVLADDNQLVGVGQPLVELDPSDYQTRLQQALAQQAQAEGQLSQAMAGVSNAESQVDVQAAAREQSVAQTRAQAVQASNAARDYSRYLGLQRANPAAVAQQQVDQAQTAALNTAAQRDAAARQTDSVAAQVAGARTQVRSASAQVKAAQAAVKTAQAQVEAARLNLSYAHVVSPVTGHVTRRTVAVGSYLQAGQEMLAIVPLDLWITANFKESQLKGIRAGQHVEVRIDAYKGIDFHGHVDSIQRGAGQAFSVLPAENATGNYVKVVQRVPVKIVLDNPDPHYPLGPGMSVVPKVRIS